MHSFKCKIWLEPFDNQEYGYQSAITVNDLGELNNHSAKYISPQKRTPNSLHQILQLYFDFKKKNKNFSRIYFPTEPNINL